MSLRQSEKELDGKEESGLDKIVSVCLTRKIDDVFVEYIANRDHVKNEKKRGPNNPEARQ